MESHWRFLIGADCCCVRFCVAMSGYSWVEIGTLARSGMLGGLQSGRCGRRGVGSLVVMLLVLRGDMLVSRHFARGVDDKLDVPQLVVV